MAHYDIIIVGGGINGAGIARDAAMRGLQVLLLERDDFASGASGKNGRMIHGGLRYLEQFEIGLVREALAERQALLKIASHLVKRRDLVIPIRRGVGRPKVMVRLGLAMLDLLSWRRATLHRYLNKKQALLRIPSLQPDGLRGAAVMFDAFVEYAERLTLENLLDAAERGATVINHAPVKRLLVAQGRVNGVTYTDANGDEKEAQAPVVVNATGAWADEFLVGATGGESTLLGPSQGTFIVVSPFEGAPDCSIFFEAALDRRPIIITPWNGLYLIGTTDERVAGRIDDVGASDREVDYLLTELALVFPGCRRTVQDVLYTYTGVRPLPRAEGRSTKVPRKHIIHDHAPGISGLLTIIGGKLSTFRSLSKEVVDLVQTKLGRPRSTCQTALTVLPGARPVRERWTGAGAQFGSRTLARLSSVYGARAGQVSDLAWQHPDLAKVIDAETGAIAAEIVFVGREEWAETYEDILIRRTMIGRNSTRGLNTLDEMGKITARHLGWTDARIAMNRDRYSRYVELSRGFAQASDPMAHRAASKGRA